MEQSKNVAEIAVAKKEGNSVHAVNGAAVSAVNKVLGVLDIIIRETVNLELEKVKKAVHGIKYSEASGTDVPKAGTIHPSVTK